MATRDDWRLRFVELMRQHQFDEAAALAGREHAVAVERSGERSPEAAQCQASRGSALVRAMQLDQAEPVLRDALAVREETRGEAHPDTIHSLHSLGALLWRRGQKSEAEPLLFRAVAGASSPTTRTPDAFIVPMVRDLISLQESRRDRRDLRKIWEELVDVLPLSHQVRALVLNRLGLLCYRLGDFDAADEALACAAEIARETVGADDPLYAHALDNRGLVKHDSGRHAHAENLHLDALEIYRRHGSEADHATCLTNLGSLFLTLGRVGEAEPLLESATQTKRRLLTGDDADLGRALHPLARLRAAQRRSSDAEALMREALRIYKAAGLPSDDTDVVSATGILASVLPSSGSLEEALQAQTEHLHTLTALLDEGHPQVAEATLVLARTLTNLERDGEAARVFRRALELHERMFGVENPQLLGPLEGLALLHIRQDEPDEAIPYLVRAAEIYVTRTAELVSTGSERTRLSYAQLAQAWVSGFLSVVVEHMPDDAVACRAALELALRTKGLVADVAAGQRAVLSESADVDLENTLRELSALRHEIQRHELVSFEERTAWEVVSHRQELRVLEAERDHMEREVAKHARQPGSLDQLSEVTCQGVASRLPSGAALVEFVRFHRSVDQHPRGEGRHSVGEPIPEYVAMTVCAGEGDGVRLVPLGTEEEIGALVRDFVGLVSGEGLGGGDLGAEGSSPGKSQQPAGSRRLAYLRSGEALRAAIFDPLVANLPKTRRLLISTDGALTLLPFQTLPSTEGRPLLRDWRIDYLSTGRDLLGGESDETPAPAGPPIVVGDPDFDFGFIGERAQNATEGPFSRLEGTADEARDIGRRLGAEPLVREDALEQVVKQCKSPRILHLATHGFFMENPFYDMDTDSAYKFRLSLTGTEIAPGASLSDRTGWELIENPLLRSGLALAGANTRLRGLELPAEAGDALLTAEDITEMSLEGTQLVVLSACRTGLGEVRSGEGVFGLRRAFALAGASTVVMSLWKVSDEATRGLMESFYERVLNGASVSESLREAQLEMSKRNPDPFVWGAFVCEGNPDRILRAA